MPIQEFIWSDDRIDHIAKHNVEPHELEEACFSRPLVERAKSQGPNPVYYMRGQTNSGRYLFCVVVRFSDGNAYPITARDMTKQELRRYRQWKRK